MTTNELVKLFWERDERALEETQKRYADYCFSLANNILCNREDAEECVNDTYLRIWRSIPPARPKNFVAYLAKTVHNLSVDKLKARLRGKRNAPIVALEELEECLFSDNDDFSEGVELAELQTAIDRFLRTCPERDRAIFIRRYFFCETQEFISEKFGTTTSNTTKILVRTRNKLKDYLKKEGYYI